MDGRRRQLFRAGLLLAGTGLLAGCGPPARTESATRVPGIGFLGATSLAAEAARIEAFRQGLRQLGYVEGETIAIEWRWADGQFDRLPALATELAQLPLKVVVTGGPRGTRVARDVITRIPLVTAQDSDPVGTGLVASLARPSGNITGLTSLSAELNTKRLELLKETVPGLSRVTVFVPATGVGSAEDPGKIERAAEAVRVQLQYLDVRGPEDLEGAFREAARGRAEAVLVLSNAVLESRRAAIADLAAQSRIPTIYPFAEFVEAGGLMAYGVSIPDLYRRAAAYVDKILKGAKPGDLPVEQPTKFDLAINLKAAQALRLTVPPAVLAQATEVIR